MQTATDNSRLGQPSQYERVEADNVKVTGAGRGGGGGREGGNEREGKEGKKEREERRTEGKGKERVRGSERLKVVVGEVGL